MPKSAKKKIICYGRTDLILEKPLNRTNAKMLYFYYKCFSKFGCKTLIFVDYVVHNQIHNFFFLNFFLKTRFFFLFELRFYECCHPCLTYKEKDIRINKKGLVFMVLLIRTVIGCFD